MTNWEILKQLMEVNKGIEEMGLENIKNIILIKNRATNGDVVKAAFPNAKIVETDLEVFLYTGTREKDEDIQIFDTEWWNAPYQKGGKE